ncbi:unnamed protein product [Penicillium pancosmium]
MFERRWSGRRLGRVREEEKETKTKWAAYEEMFIGSDGGGWREREREQGGGEEEKGEREREVDDVEPPQLRFLSDAANLLGSSSPSTAAHLLTAHTHILHDESKSLTPRQTKHHCAGCGSLRICKASKPTVVKTKQKSRTAIRGSATVHKCVRCNQRAVIPRRRSAPRDPSKAPSRVSTATAVDSAASTPSISSQQDLPAIAPTTASTEKTVENASSKKRAKARKQGGLQALLAAKKSTQPSLDLLDFLQ